MTNEIDTPSDRACRPPAVEVAGIPKLFEFKHTKTRIRVFTHRSYYARPNAVFEDPPGDIAPDNETLEFVGDSVLNLAVATLISNTYPGLRVGPLAKIRSLVVQNATIAQISEHYQLAQQLRANSSQLYNLRFSPAVQADLFEAYLGGLYTDWGYEHIRPWLFRVLGPYVKEAYRTVQREYIDPSPGKSSRPPAAGGLPPNKVLEARQFDSSPKASSPSRAEPSPISGESDMNRFPSMKKFKMDSIQVRHLYDVPDLPANVFDNDSLGSGSPMPPGYSPAPQSDSESRQYMPSAVAEGHLPLLNQVLQHAKRWIDWEYKLDPKAPSTTPIWDAYGKMSDVDICTGRGNTKKLAKNDAARRLVTELQRRAGRHCTTSDLAKELVQWYTERKSMGGLEGADDTTIVDEMSGMTLNESKATMKKQPTYNYSFPTGSMN